MSFKKKDSVVMNFMHSIQYKILKHTKYLLSCCVQLKYALEMSGWVTSVYSV